MNTTIHNHKLLIVVEQAPCADYKHYPAFAGGSSKRQAVTELGQHEIDGVIGRLFLVSTTKAHDFGADTVIEHYEFVIDTVGVEEAANEKGVAVQSVRNALDAGKFPGAYQLSGDPRRAEWRIPRAEVEAWQPRNYPRG